MELFTPSTDFDANCSHKTVNNNSSSSGDLWLDCPSGGGGHDPSSTIAMDTWMLTIVVLYVVVCCFGIVTNGIVMYVIVVASKAVTVTNIYVLNLAVSDFLFLAGVPFTVVTAVTRMWIFGGIMCKVFWATTSINWFTSFYTLTVLSADRYFAICHAFWSIPYRTPTVARLVCAGVWTVSLVVMLPIVVYGGTVEGAEGEAASCTVDWPENDLGVDPYHAFVGYSFGLGFVVPIGMITVFYSLVVFRLKGIGPNSKTMTRSTRSQHAQTRVTLMVTLVTAVNVICWLPYWIFQLVFLFAPGGADGALPRALVYAFQLATVLNYANSAANPVLYAFLSDSFVKSLRQAFDCPLRRRSSSCCGRWRRGDGDFRGVRSAYKGRCGGHVCSFKGGGGGGGRGGGGGGPSSMGVLLGGGGGRSREYGTVVVVVEGGGGTTCSSLVMASETTTRLGRESGRGSDLDQMELKTMDEYSLPTPSQEN